jgi:hypothetical protein
VRFGQLLADRHKLGRRQPQPAPFEPGDYLPDQAALDAIGFNEYKRLFHKSLHNFIVSKAHVKRKS